MQLRIRPSIEEVVRFAAEECGGGRPYRRYPVSTEIFADVATPIEVLRKLKNVSAHTYILESAEAQEQWGRYTFLGYDPKLDITCLNGRMTVGDLSF